jgi:hypothetical protein
LLLDRAKVSQFAPAFSVDQGAKANSAHIEA